MKKISNKTLLNIVTKLLVLALIAKALSLALWYYLPNDSVELQVTNSYQPKYQRVDFKNMIEKTDIRKKEPKHERKKMVVKKSGISITNMILKGLYGTNEKGFAIVALKSAPKKTTIISVGEIYSGYTLKYINPDGIIFEKESKEYILNLLVVKNSSSIQKVKRTKYSKNVNKALNIDTSDEPREVTRADIAFYAKNPKQIWRDISIREVKERGKIIGFKITKISKKSKFATLGLKRGDLIIKANNIKLTSYRDAIKLYNNINQIDTMQIVVIRDQQEKELIYDIH
ncbi:MAG: site-2 protease family protein [Campylobacterota bacterium]|nr:site-2 protease family protein [Campylobacterota bacterium]